MSLNSEHLQSPPEPSPDPAASDALEQQCEALLKLLHKEYDPEVVALVESFRATGDRKAIELIALVYRRLERAQQWYGNRFDRLWHWAHAELNEQQKTRYFNIVANGSADWNEAPGYRRQVDLDLLKARADRAEAALAELQAKHPTDTLAADQEGRQETARLDWMCRHPLSNIDSNKDEHWITAWVCEGEPGNSGGSGKFCASGKNVRECIDKFLSGDIERID